MTWSNQDPQAGEILISAKAHHAGIVEIDKIRKGQTFLYRVTYGDLFNSTEVTRTADLETALRLSRSILTASSLTSLTEAIGAGKAHKD